MKLSKTFKKFLAYVCAIAMVITSITIVPSQNVNAGSSEGLTLATDDTVTEGGWKFYTGGAGGTAGEVYYGGGATVDYALTLYIQKTTNNEWGIQIWSPEFTGLTEGVEYQYTVTFTADKAGSFKVKDDASNSAQVKASYVEGENEVKGEFTSNGTAKLLLADFTGTADDTTLVITDITITDDFEKEVVELPDEEKNLTSEANLAYGKDATVSNYKEGSTNYSVLTDGVCNLWNSYVGTYTPGYIEVDLGKVYAASSIDQVVVWFRNGSADLYPASGYKIQFGDVAFNTVATVTGLTGGSTAWEDGNQYMVSTTLDKENITGNVKKVRIQIDNSVPWGAQVTEVAVYAANPQDGTEVAPAEKPAGVTVSSTKSSTVDGSITFNVEAGENQDGYTYNVFLDDETLPKVEKCNAGQDYTITGVKSGVHTVSVISVSPEGGVSEAIQSEEVKVETVIDDIKDLTKNFAIGKEWELLPDPNSNLTHGSAEGTGDITNGVISGNDYVCPVKGTEGGYYIIDLGKEVDPSKIDSVHVFYRIRVGGCYPEQGGQQIQFAGEDKEFVTVGTLTQEQFNAQIADAPFDVVTEDFDVTQIDAVRYVKVYYPNAVGYGAQVTEIAVMGDTGIRTVDAPTIPSQTYTGETLTAVVPESDDYTVTENKGGVEAGTYDVVLTLADDCYWSDGDTARTKTLSFEITKATDNEWTEDIEIEEWIYDFDGPYDPTAEAKYGEPTFVYSDSEDGEYTDEVPSLPGIYYVKAIIEDTDSYNGLESEPYEFEIYKGDQDAPEGVSAIDATLEENADGSIIGVTDAMEYRAADDDTYDEDLDDYVYTKIEGTSVDGLKAGVYYVRYAENDLYDASDDVEVEIKTGRKLNVTLTEGTGYTLTGSTDPVEYNADYTFTLTLSDGFKKDSQPVVKVNGEVVAAGADGTYAVKVTADIVVTVEGVVADIPETTTQTPTTTVKPPVTTTAQVKAPGKASIKKIYKKKKSSKNLKLKIKAIKGAKGYQVAVYKTSKNAKKNKSALVKKYTKKLTYTVKSSKLKNKKTLYVKVRAYVLDAKGTKVYGKWSKTKKVKAK